MLGGLYCDPRAVSSVTVGFSSIRHVLTRGPEHSRQQGGTSCLSVCLHCDAQEWESTSEESVLMPGHALNVRSRESWRSLVNVAFWPLDLRLLHHFENVVDLDLKVADCAFQLGVPELQLDGSKILRGAVD